MGYSFLTQLYPTQKKAAFREDDLKNQINRTNLMVLALQQSS